MDDIDFLSKIFSCLSQNESIEYRLKTTLHTIRPYLQVDIAAILIIPENHHDCQIICSGGDDALIEEYKKDYFYADQFHNFPEGKTIVFQPRDDDGDPLAGNFSEFCRNKVGIAAVAAADLQLHNHLEVRLRLTRSAQQAAFTDREITLIDKIVPHLKNTIDQAIHAQYHSLFDASAQKVLAHFRIGMLIINKELDILDKSSLSEELLAKSNALVCNGGKLVTRSRDYQAKVEQMIQDLCGNDEILYRTLSIIAPKTGAEYTIAITRDDAGPLDNLIAEHRFNVFIFSSLDEKIDMSILVGLWKVSPAEQRVLSAMMRYDNVKKVAIELKISPNTAKAQLKSVYRKLGIVSKTMLIKRLNSVRNMTALLS
jgi:DNA-binding CsgD family transcriptional regulator